VAPKGFARHVARRDPARHRRGISPGRRTCGSAGISPNPRGRMQPEPGGRDLTSTEPVLLSAHKIGVHDGAVTGYEDRVVPTGVKDAVQCDGPRGRVGIVVDGRISGFLHQIAAEHHCALVVDNHNQVVVGMSRTRVANTCRCVAEIDGVA
jgi:hypothetical protein